VFTCAKQTHRNIGPKMNLQISRTWTVKTNVRPEKRNIDVSLFRRVLFKSLPYLSNWIIK
jgi:hypothetical protein